MNNSGQSGLPAILTDRLAREFVAGFLLIGMLMGILGSLLVAWDDEFDRDPRQIGLHFLAFNLGVLAAALLAQRLLRRVSIRAMCIGSCALAAGAFAALGVALSVNPVWWRIAGIAILGASAGALLTALLYFLKPYYEDHAAATMNFCGLLFGLGCLLATLTVGAAYPLYSIQWETLLLGVIPLLFCALYWRAGKLPRLQPPAHSEDPLGTTLKDLHSVAAVLFSLLLFFQCGNEWAIAGWLPLFLIHRLGSSPKSAIFVLALYFLALLAGRIIAQILLARLSHTGMLAGSIITAMLGYLLLSSTNSIFGAGLAAIVTGLAFAPIYPLVSEKIGRRFDYHPGFFNGLFSVAIAGGMFAPWLLGYVDAYLGMRFVMLLPAFGSVAVLLLMLLIMLESTLMGDDARAGSAGAARATHP